MSVVAHFINSDWQLEKMILGMRLIDCSHNGENIAERVACVASDYGISDKIFSTLDNASANTKAMGQLTPLLSGYVGSLLLHQRCACHIINLIVKSGLDSFKDMLTNFRTAISFLNASNQRIAAYKSYCIAMGVRPRKFCLDMDVRWNSTYLMLKHLIPHRETFFVWITTNYPLKDGESLLTNKHWDIAEKILSFLEQFHDSTVVLSGVYYPTSPLVLHPVFEIASHLNEYQFDNDLRFVVNPMKDKFLAYWSDIPMLYSFAFILDPRAKIKGFTSVLRLLSILIDYSSYLTEVRAELSEIYKKYETKFGSMRVQRPTQPVTTGKKKYSWGKIFADDDGGSGNLSSGSLVHSILGFGSGAIGSCSSASAASLSRRGSSASDLLQAAQAGSSLPGSELTSYLDSDTVNFFDEEWSVLSWWRDHKLTYHVLSILAKDIFTVSVSTIRVQSLLLAPLAGSSRSNAEVWDQTWWRC